MKNKRHMFKFVKIKDTKYNIEYPYMMLCDNKETLMLHEKIFMEIEYKKMHDNFIHKKFKGYHMTSKLAIIINSRAELRGTSLLEEAIAFENEMVTQKLLHIEKYGAIYLREDGTYTLSVSTQEIISTVEKDIIVYPPEEKEYTYEDIRIINWEGGKHFYAKIGNLDVVDNNGNQKWNSWKDAREKAVEMVWKLKKKKGI